MKHTTALDDSDFVLRNDVMRAFTKSSWEQNPPEIGFGTGSRPPLNSVSGGGPGPGAYPIKTTMGKLMESHITSPSQFSLKGRTKFGDPYSRAISKDTANQPGPGQYNLTGKFLGGTNPRKTGFPKSMPPRDKALLAPGPGQYKPLFSMGKQVLSTKPGPVVPSFAKSERPTLIPPGTTDIGPGEYVKANIAACESQVDSRKPTCGSIKFGTGYKKGSSY